MEKTAVNKTDKHFGFCSEFSRGDQGDDPNRACTGAPALPECQTLIMHSWSNYTRSASWAS